MPTCESEDWKDIPEQRCPIKHPVTNFEFISNNFSVSGHMWPAVSVRRGGGQQSSELWILKHCIVCTWSAQMPAPSSWVFHSCLKGTA